MAVLSGATRLHRYLFQSAGLKESNRRLASLTTIKLACLVMFVLGGALWLTVGGAFFPMFDPT